jgi:rRNA maturation protein Nop10
MSTETCKHCGGDISIRNPTGWCDHLYWPDNLTEEAKRANGYPWHTGSVIRMCDCGIETFPASPCLRVRTDGTREWATCPACGRTWDMRTLQEASPPPAAVLTLGANKNA